VGVDCSSFFARPGQQPRPSAPRRNRLTSHSSGRLRRRLIPALVGSSCWFFVACVSPSFALARRRSPQQHFAQRRGKSQLSELVVWGRLLIVFRLPRPTASPKHASSQPSNISFKRTAAPPLNSSVRLQIETKGSDCRVEEYSATTWCGCGSFDRSQCSFATHCHHSRRRLQPRRHAYVSRGHVVIGCGNCHLGVGSAHVGGKHRHRVPPRLGSPFAHCPTRTAVLAISSGALVV